MTDLAEFLRQVERNPSPELWGDIESRATEPGAPAPEPASRSRLVAGLIAAVVAVAAFAFAFVAFVGPGSPDRPSPATSDAVSEIKIEGTVGDLSATWSLGGRSWAGVPVDVVVPVEDPDAPSKENTFSLKGAEFFGLKAFSVDTTSLRQASLDPIPVPADALIASAPQSVMLLAFSFRDTPGSDTTIGPERSMTPLFPTPTDIHVLDPGPYRFVAVGRTSDGSLFQFGFAVDITSGGQGTDATIPTGNDFVHGDAPLGEDLANMLGLTLEGPYQSKDGTYTGKCSYFVEVGENGTGYCLEDIEASPVDLAAIAEGLQGHRIDESEWNNIKAMVSGSPAPPLGG